MNKIKIKKFVEEYNNKSSEHKDSYLHENLEIVEYIPFIKKDALAQRLVNVSTYRFEDYRKEDGTMGRRRTDKIHVNSIVQYILFCRLVIENYTNLEVETEGFYEEYDLLKQSGLLEKLMIGNESQPSLIPESEIAEFRTIVDMKQRDVLNNYTAPQNYIANQVEHISTVLGVSLRPLLDKLSEKIDQMDTKDIEKIGNKIEKTLKRIK